MNPVCTSDGWVLTSTLIKDLSDAALSAGLEIDYKELFLCVEKCVDKL